MPIDSNCMEKVSLFVTAAGLPKVPNFSNTDPFAVVYSKDALTDQLVKIGNTEVIMDTLNPNWATSFSIDYLFEVSQEIVIRTYHQESKSHPITDPSKHTFLGEVTFLVATLMRTNSSTLTLDITGGRKIGKITVRGEAQANTRDLFAVTFSGNKLANKDGMFGTSDPFLEISRLNEDGSYSTVWKNAKIDNSLNPRWGEAKIPMTTLCNGDIDRPLRIGVFDWDKSGKHKSMGVVNTSVRAMLTSNGAGLDVIEADKKAKNKSYTNSGTLSAANVHIEHHPTFSEFIAGGCEINLVVAIDFTGSNGDPESPQSLHFINPHGKYNAYQDAISSVGSVLQQYDNDKMYSVYGFGARVRLPDGEFSAVQHCFPVYGGGVEVQGLPGLLQAYKECLGNIMLSGPTLFGPLIGAASSIAGSANCSQEKQKYTILLVLTDGVINDQDAAIQAIIEASHQPLSIIIVGVGSADFSEMSVLDGDKQLLRHGTQTAVRDIVQFVTYNEAANSGSSVLAQKVLAEVPNQVLKYFEQRNILPNKKK